MPDPHLVLVTRPGAEREALLSGLLPRQDLHCESSLPRVLAGIDLLWIHDVPGWDEPPPASDSPSQSVGSKEVMGCQASHLSLGEDEADTVRHFVEEGGRLLLTGSAAALTGPLGIEEQPPVLRQRRWEGPLREEDRLGIASFLPHPLFRRFPGGVYLRRPYGRCWIGGAYYEKGQRPKNGRLLGVEKVYLGMDPLTGVLVEHEYGEGRVLSLGAHLVFSDPDATGDLFEEARLRFTVDMIDYLLGTGPGERYPAWPSNSEESADPEEPAVTPLLDFEIPSTIAKLSLDSLSEERDCLYREPAGESWFDLPGRRAVLLMGNGEEGLRELWRLPVRHISSWRWSDCDGKEASWQQLVVRPSAVSRRFRAGTASFEEHWISPHDGITVGCSLVNLEDREASLRLAIAGDHRFLWPYPAGVLGRSDWERHADPRIFRLRDGVLGHCCYLAFTIPPEERSRQHDAQSDDAAVLDLSFDLPARSALDAYLVMGTSEAEARESLLEALASGTDLLPRAQAHRKAIRDGALVIRTGKSAIDEEIRWVFEKGHEFFTETRIDSDAEPYRGYLAGFQTTRPGWSSGRPGYAWFFGRDSLLTSRALLPWGQRDEVRANLELLARHQGPNGEIFHELTPSGVVHYDAADATPMFVEAVGNYVDWSGDLAFAERVFSHVERALAFLEERDRDGDGITENTGVGHGWMEGGPLKEGVHAETYLAAWQCAALLAGAGLARRLEKDALAKDWQAQAEHARSVLCDRFWSEEHGRFAHAMRKDGSFDWSPTILASLPAYLELVPKEQAERSMVAFASESYSTDWGVRLLDREDPRFDPTSYQAGSVWPLFTGWASVADFLVGRPGPAWERLSGLLGLVTSFDPGVIEEVFRGDVFSPAGICPHQAWSHAAALSALASGLLGAGVERGRDALRFAPCLPGALDSLDFEALQFRDSTLAGSIERDADGKNLTIVMSSSGGDGVDVDFAPFLPSPCSVEAVRIDGESADFEVEDLGEGVRVRVAAVRFSDGQERRIEIQAVPDFLLVDRTLRPDPDHASHGPRVIERRCGRDARDLHLTVEAKPGHHSFPVRFPGRMPSRIIGAELAQGALRFEVEAEPASDRYVRHEIDLSFGEAPE